MKINKEMGWESIFFRLDDGIVLSVCVRDLKKIIKDKISSNKREIFEKLESKRTTDNVDYISIPIKEWFKIKENETASAACTYLLSFIAGIFNESPISPMI